MADLLKVCDGTTWVTVSGGGGSVSADSLDFTEFKDSMALDASTDISASGTDVLSITNTGTGNSFLVNDVASDATPFVIDAAGNVGIGTATPSEILHVRKDQSAQTTLRMDNNDGGAAASTIFDFRNGALGIADRLLFGVLGTGYTAVTGWQDAGIVSAQAGLSGGLILNANAGGVKFETGGNGSSNQKMVLTNAGLVGIGTTSPAYKLDVLSSTAANRTGDVVRFGHTNLTQGIAIGYNQIAMTGTDVNDPLYIDAMGNGKLILQSTATGNVGIGTTAPTNLLSLGGDAARTIWMERSATAAATGNSLTLQAGGTKSGNTDQNGGDLVLSSGTATGTGSSNITFKTTPAGTTGTTDRAPATAMTILGNGNVGIGTATPAQMLEEAGNIALSASGGGYLFGEGSTSLRLSTGFGTKLSYSATNYIAIGGPISFVTSGVTQGSFETNGGFWMGSTRVFPGPGNAVIEGGLSVGSTALATSGAIIQGNVGIGTIAPTNLLSLGGDASRTIWMERSATAAATGNILTLQAGGTKSGNTDQNGGDLVLSSGTATGTGSSNITFKTATAGTTGTTDRAPATAMTILGNGNVGIGTTTPNQGKMEVKGGTVCVDTDSDDNATSCITNESDIRLKKNIEVIPHALDTLAKLRGVLFDWRWDEFPAIADYKALGRDAGVIAQEVEAAYPQGMGEKLNGYKTVRYDRLVPLLIQSVKELKAANDNLKSQLDAMATSHEAEIEALRQEIRAK